jgi:hypothetical protein
MTIKNIILALVIGALGAVGGGLIVSHNQQQEPTAGGLGALITGPLTSASSTVTTTSSQVLATSTSRIYAAIVNDGSNSVYLSVGVNAVAGKGILLTANGGSYEINDQNLITGGIYAITSTGSSNVTVLYK